MTRSTKHLENEQRHATRVVAGKVEWTGARAENGDPVPPSADDLARLGAEKYDEYKEWREKQIAEQEAKKREQDDRKRFEQRFVAQGGSKSKAAAAWQARRDEQAAEVAAQADSEAIRRTRSRIRSRL